MDGSYTDQMGAVFLVIVVHVGDVLEVVGVDGAVLGGVVGGAVVGELHDFQRDVLFGEDVLDHGQNLGVGGGGGAYFQGGALLLAAAGEKGEGQGAGEGQSGQLFDVHGKHSF